MSPWAEEVGTRGRQRPSCGRPRGVSTSPFFAASVLGRRPTPTPKQLCMGISEVNTSDHPVKTYTNPGPLHRLAFHTSLRHFFGASLGGPPAVQHVGRRGGAPGDATCERRVGAPVGRPPRLEV
jgi:hypothetical protein